MVKDDGRKGPRGAPAIAAAKPLSDKTVRLSLPETAETDLPGTMLLSDLLDLEPDVPGTVVLEAEPQAPGAPIAPRFESTVMLGEDDAPPGESALPFREAISPWATPAAQPEQGRPPPEPASTGTITLSQEEQRSAADRPQHPFPERPPAARWPASPSWGQSPAPRLEPELAPRVPSEIPLPPAWIGATPPPVTTAAPDPEPPEGGIALEHPPSLAVALLPVAPSPGGRLLTVIARATADLRRGTPARLRAEANPLPADVLADFAEAKLRSDVTLVGHACAATPGARSGEVSFRFGHPDQGFHRRIAVFGDRRWVRRSRLPAISAPEPFDQIPLRHERAFGGPGYAWNPVGVGFNASAGSALPNLEDPEHPIRSLASEPRPACFAPIPPAWEGGARPQAASRAQQLPFLQGDEPFAIAGVRPGGAVIEGRLPGLRVRALARKARRSEPAVELAVRLETVAFDTDAMTVTLDFRGTLAVPGDEATEMDVASLLVKVEDLAGPVAAPGPFDR